MSERSSATTPCAASSCWLGIKSTQSSTGGLLALLISAGLSSWRWLLLTDIVLCISWSRWDCRRNKSSINNNCQSSQRGASTSIQRATNALLFLKCCMTYPFCRTSLSADPSLVNLNFSVMAVPPPVRFWRDGNVTQKSTFLTNSTFKTPHFLILLLYVRHRLKTHLEAASPALMEMQIPAAPTSNQIEVIENCRWSGYT